MIYLKAFVIWLIIILTETLHGMGRTIFLEPYLGDFQVRQISVFTGSFLILIIVIFSINWLKATKQTQLIIVGIFWLILTVSFEIILGRFILNYSWARITSDYQINQGGLLPFGLLFLLLSPLIATKIRGKISQKSG